MGVGVLCVWRAVCGCGGVRCVGLLVWVCGCGCGRRQVCGRVGVGAGVGVGMGVDVFFFFLKKKIVEFFVFSF